MTEAIAPVSAFSPLNRPTTWSIWMLLISQMRKESAEINFYELGQVTPDWFGQRRGEGWNWNQ
jgi:hypothetical protein